MDAEGESEADEEQETNHANVSERVENDVRKVG